MNSSSALSVLYNDQSVLENHHCSCCFAAVERSGVLASLSPPDFKLFRSLVVAAILGTDMSSHKELVARTRLRTDAAAGDSPEGAACFSRELDDRTLAVAYILHCSDLCCPLLPPAISRRIACALAEEFEGQAALERAKALPITVCLAPDMRSKAQLEIGFADHVVVPLFKTFSRLAPGVGSECLARIAANRAAWCAAVGRTSHEQGTHGNL